MRRHLLDTGWSLQLQPSATTTMRPPANLPDGPMPARVPGCVHTALLAAGHIADPLLGDNEGGVQWVGEQPWWYTCAFEAPAELLDADHLELALGQVDTVADVLLNGVHLGRTESMHVAYRFDVHAALRAGHNQLEVVFTPPLAWAQEQEARLGRLPHVETHPFNFIRKMACNFGWDWGPCLITCGIYEAPVLEGWSVARVAGVRPSVLAHGDGSMGVSVTVDLVQAPASSGVSSSRGGLPPLPSGEVVVHATLRDPEGRAVATCSTPVASVMGHGGQTACVELPVPAPQRWWPRGYGAQPLYALEVAVRAGDVPVDTWTRRIGLRTVALDTSLDQAGSRFQLVVNGLPVFCLGANWVPNDVFLDRVGADVPGEPRLRARIGQAVDANMNLLRVWGGGIYESEAFYRVCDELGVMVWQDFAFACAMVPEEPPFDALVEAEARHQITRLSHHPSLVLWNGCNENFWGYEDWGSWKRDVEGRTWGRGFYLELFPHLVGELDPTRPYWPGSPYSRDGVHPLDDRHGTMHLWDAWNTRDYAAYHEVRPRFAAEFGYQAPATLATLAEAEPAGLGVDPRALEHRQKAARGMQKLRDRLVERFDEGVVDGLSPGAWITLTQLNQARAVASGSAWFRSLAPRCTGVVYWQLNDCWPAISWSCVDYGGRRKLLWYATRQVFAPRLLTIQPAQEGERGGLELCAINDHDEPWQAEVRLRRVGFDGVELAAATAAVRVAPRSVGRLALSDDVAVPRAPARELIVADTPTARRATWFFDVDKRLAYPSPAWTIDVHATPSSEHPGELAVAVRAQTLLRDLVLLTDTLAPNACVDEQLVTLLPGEEHVFWVTGLGRDSAILDAAQIATRHMLQCANVYCR